MKLKKWLKRSRISHCDFAKELGTQTHLIVLWCERTISPGLLNTLKIIDFTKNEVNAKDLLSVDHEKRLKEYWDERNISF